MALTRLFNAMLRDSRNPCVQTPFILLDSRLRFGIWAKVEGVVNESGRFVVVFPFSFCAHSIFSLLWIPVIILLPVGAYFVLG